MSIPSAFESMLRAELNKKLVCSNPIMTHYVLYKFTGIYMYICLLKQICVLGI